MTIFSWITTKHCFSPNPICLPLSVPLLQVFLGPLSTESQLKALVLISKEQKQIFSVPKSNFCTLSVTPGGGGNCFTSQRNLVLKGTMMVRRITGCLRRLISKYRDGETSGVFWLGKIFATTWLDLEDTMLSEINQTEKDKYCMISLIFGI